jgi:RNA polymerase sigma-70 factor (ECF subfamily)
VATRIEPVGLAAAMGPRGADVDGATLEAALRTVLAQATAAWPGVALEPAGFVQYLAARLPDGADAVTALRALHTADLYLACGCARGEPAALAAFERHVAPAMAPALAAARVPAALLDELRQTLRVLLFVPGQHPPGICNYAGRGPLARWVQIAAVRQARTLMRRRKTHGEPTAAAELDLLAGGPDPALAFLKQRDGAAVTAAVREALAALAPRERTVLRLHFVDGLNIGAIGALYRVHRATVARWIAQAREAVFQGTHRALGARLGLGARELDSLMDLVRSRMALTLGSALGEPPERG